MHGHLIEDNLKDKVLKGIRWASLCWVWMFGTIIVSPLFHSNDRFSDLWAYFLVLYIVIFLSPYLVHFVPGLLMTLVKALVFIWVASQMTIGAQMFLLMTGIPVVLLDELIVINSYRPFPLISLLYIVYIVAYAGKGNTLVLSEAATIICFLVGAAYVYLYHWLSQTVKLHDTNLRLSAANQKIADLTAEKVHQEIARELHDTLTQDVVGINMQLSAVKMLAKKHDYTKLNQMIDQTEAMATAAIKHSRGLIKQYREYDGQQQKKSLSAILQTTVKGFQDQYGLQTHLIMDEDILVASEELHDIERVLAEALMNVVKHGKTKEANVTVSVDGSNLKLVITNQGWSLKIPQPKDGHYGIQNMKERTERHGGNLTYYPVSRDGIKVVATFLIEEEDK